MNDLDRNVAKAEIVEANKKLMAFVAAGDSSGIASLYTTDAKLMFTGKPSVVGRENIQTAFSEILESGVSKIELKTMDVFGAGDLVAEEGEVTVYVNNNAVAEKNTSLFGSGTMANGSCSGIMPIRIESRRVRRMAPNPSISAAAPA